MSSNSNHRPRKKRRQASPVKARSDLVLLDSSKHPKPAFPLVAFLWPARGIGSQWVMLPLILMVVGLFRWTTSFWGYSGFQKPPMYGDFEAQRHWMEISIHLPISTWYFYDLQYWGLDYPPLTAYHSWILGKVGSFLNPSWYALDESRGFESQNLKVYMRATVLISEYITYIPAVVILLRKISQSQGIGGFGMSIALVAILMQPATLLIDHGHFQYNTVMLGFVVASLASIFSGRVLWSAVFFVASLSFKQMALYYSPAMFAHLLGSCLTPRYRPIRLLLLGVVTVIAFGVVFLPLIAGSAYDTYRGLPGIDLTPPELMKTLPIEIPHSSYLHTSILQLTQAVHRIFPFARGLFEDKVANFWCFFHTFYKLHAVSPTFLQRLSLYFTFFSILGPSMVICAVPRMALLPYALATSAWGFFLFSFQVHEKSVLLPLLPMTLLLGTSVGLSKEYRSWIGWANVLGSWTLYPLLKRDGLATPYAVITLLWSYLIGVPPTSFSVYHGNVDTLEDNVSWFTMLLHTGFYSAGLVWHVLEIYMPPPENKPDLYPVTNVLIGAVGFGICYLWCFWKLVLHSGILGDYMSDQVAKVKMKQRSH